MDITEQNKIYQDAIQIWGQKAQLEMVQEEAIELAMAVRKFIRKYNPNTFNDLIGEIADVENMIAQVKFMFNGIETQINEVKIQKLERLQKRILERDFEID